MKPANDNSVPANAGALTFISMFSGIEAASVAFGPLGWRAICFAEIERFPSAVLAHHYPDVPNVGDMSKHDWSQYNGKVDIVCGGPPCQAFSVAGLRESLNDARGNLSLVYMKALHAIKPRNAIVENVPGWLNTPDNAFGCFLAGLVGADAALPPPEKRKWPNAGMVAGPRARAAWCVLDAQHFGLAQRRKRVIVVADFGNGADPAAVLFERKGLPGYSPTRRETGEGVAPTISARTKGGGGLGTDFDLDGGLVESFIPTAHGTYGEGLPTLRAAGGDCSGGSESLVYAPEIARCVATREGSSQDYESTTMVAVSVTGQVSHALSSEGADASEDGTGRGTPIVAQTVALRGREGGATAELGGEVATALRASSGGGDKPHVLAPTVYSIMPQNSGRDYKAREVEVAQPLMAGGPAGGNQGGDYILQSAVRRLTPKECERPQGFPDDYTNIPWRSKEESPDGPRYKALGNSWATTKFRWLGERIAKHMPRVAANDNNKQDIASAA